MASAGLGVAVVAGAFAIGFYSALISDGGTEPLAVAAMTTPVCGMNLVALPGGQCFDRAEVTAGEYQACVRSGACEPVQREFDLPARIAAPATPAASAASAATMPAGVATPPASAAPRAAPPPEGSSGRDDRTAHCNAGLPGRESYSVNCVTFLQARRYCEWRGGRLPTRSEWEQAASPEHALAGVDDLNGGLSEWSVEPTGAGVESRERVVVLGGGLDTGAGAAGALSRLYTSANAQGRNVGFRCVVQADRAPGSALATNRDPAQPPR